LQLQEHREQGALHWTSMQDCGGWDQADDGAFFCGPSEMLA